MARDNYKKGNIEVDGRTFEVEFWNDPSLGLDLPYFEVSEIIIEEKKPWYSKQIKTYTRKISISYGWTDQNRLEVAKHKIENYLQREKDEAEEKRIIEEFCNVSR